MADLPATRVCAVVVTYNRAALLETCLAALRRQTHPLAHVVVIDNASTDATPDVLAGVEGIEIIRLNENLGSAGGFAAGVAHATQQSWEWLWLMDDDVEPRPDALETLLLAAAPGVAALGPVKVGASGRVQALHIADYTVATMHKRAVSVPTGETRDVSFLSFVGLLVRGDVARAEIPRADFFIDQDDTEYALRLARHGRLVGVGDSVVVHHNEQAVRTRRVLGRTVIVGGTWRIYYAVRNPLLIARLHGSPSERAVSAVVGALRLAGRLAAALVHHRADLRRWTPALRGYLDGLRGRTGPVVRPHDYR